MFARIRVWILVLGLELQLRVLIAGCLQVVLQGLGFRLAWFRREVLAGGWYGLMK